MSHWMHRSAGLALLAVSAVVLGCGEAPRGDRIIVKGKVTIDGKEAEGVTLSFYGPTDKAASGLVTTQADGTYEVMFMSAAGEGNYKITATKTSARGNIQPGEGIDEFQLKLANAGPSGLPARYADVGKSGLTAALLKGANEGKNFALKSK